MSTENNVHALPGADGLPANPLQLAPRRLHFCSHADVLLDEHTRTITCSDPKCGAVLDPFSFLLSNAQTIQRAWSNYKHVSAQASEIAERVHALKKEEQRLRAMVKRLQEKSGGLLSTRPKEL